MKRVTNLIKLAIIGTVFLGLGATGLSTRWSQISGTPMAAGAETYKAKCAACHGGDGGGATPAGQKLGVRDLRSAVVQSQSDSQLLAIVSKGKGKMPAYEKTLGAGACSELVNYVRSLKK